VFIFIKNIKKNKIINKSVLNQIYSSKLSLIIILLFFGVSFSLVGGTQILNNLGARSIETQFNDYNLYQNEIKGNIFGKQDSVQNFSYRYYNSWINDNSKNLKKIDTNNIKYINP